MEEKMYSEAEVTDYMMRAVEAYKDGLKSGERDVIVIGCLGAGLLLGCILCADKVIKATVAHTNKKKSNKRRSES